MEGKVKIKDVFKPETILKEFYTGGLIELMNDGETLLCQCRNHIAVVNIEKVIISQTIPPGLTEYNASEEDNDVADDILTFVLSSDNELLATAHKSGLFKLWKWKDSELMSSWKSTHKGPVTKLAFNESNSRLISGSIDSVLRIWDIENYSHNSKLTGLQGVTSILECHKINDVEFLFASGDDAVIRGWCIQTDGSHNLVYKLMGHFSKITKILFATDNLYLISCSRDKVIIVWNLTDKTQLKTIPTYESIETAALLPDSINLPGFENPVIGVLVAAAGDSGKIQIWDVIKGKELYVHGVDTSTSKQSPTVHLIFNLKKCYLLEANSNQNITLYNLDCNFSYFKQMIGYLDEILDITYFGENENYLAVATNSCDIHLYDENMNCNLLKGHTDLVVSLTTSRALPHILVSGSKDNSVRVWMIKDDVLNCVAIGSRHTASVGAVALSFMSGASFIISASEDCTLKLWQLPILKFKKCETLTTTQATIAHEKAINSVCASPNNILIATASQDKTVKLWSANDLSLKGILRGHRRGVWCVKFSPVDQVLLSSSADATIRLWSVADLSCLKTLEGQDCAVLNCSFINNGIQIISNGSDGLLKIWLIKSGECVATLDKHAARIWAIAVNKDESIIVSGGADSRIVFWHDRSEQTRLEGIQTNQEKVEQEQRLSNLIKSDKLLPAIELAITLDRPMQVLNIIESVLGDKLDDLKTVIGQLRTEHKETLLNYATQWNTNSKRSYAAQLILAFLIEDVASNKLKISDKNLEGLIAYTDRHYKRLTTLQGDLHLLTYSLKMMEPHAT